MRAITQIEEDEVENDLHGSVWLDKLVVVGEDAPPETGLEVGRGGQREAEAEEKDQIPHRVGLPKINLQRRLESKNDKKEGDFESGLCEMGLFIPRPTVYTFKFFLRWLLHNGQVSLDY